MATETHRGQRVSASGRKLSGTSALPKALGVAPQGRAVKIAASKAGKGIKLPRPRSDKRTTSALVKATNRTPVLVAEFLIAMVIIGVHSVSSISKNGYQNTISNIMLRFSAVVALWFVLFLISTSKKGTTFAAWFGALLDLGILFAAAQGGAIADLQSIVQGQPITSATQLVDLKKDATEFYATHDANPTSAGPNA